MSGLERIGDLFGTVQRRCEREGTFEGLAGHQFHDERAPRASVGQEAAK